MKRSEELKQELEELKAIKDQKYKEVVSQRVNPTEVGWEAAWSEYYLKYGKHLSEEIREHEQAIIVETNREIEVGDGVTMCLYSDREACTVIAKTAKTITIQRDKATLDPNFKPKWEAGGFSAVCLNQHEQKWTYERDPNGAVTRCYWSERLGRYTTGGDQSIGIIVGRHEWYDYNF